MSATAVATTPYEKAVAAVTEQGGTVTRLPDAKPSPRRRVAGGRKAPTRNLVQEAADKIVQDSAATTAAIKAGKLTKKEKAKPAASKGKPKGPVARLTETWNSARGKDVKVKDLVKMKDGTIIEVIGRWTKKSAKGNVPMVTGKIVSGAPDGKAKGDRQNAAAAEVTHTK